MGFELTTVVFENRIRPISPTGATVTTIYTSLVHIQKLEIVKTGQNWQFNRQTRNPNRFTFFLLVKSFWHPKKGKLTCITSLIKGVNGPSNNSNIEWKNVSPNKTQPIHSIEEEVLQFLLFFQCGTFNNSFSQTHKSHVEKNKMILRSPMLEIYIVMELTRSKPL